MSTSAKELAVEIVRYSTLPTLYRAVASESLSSVYGVHESALKARLGAIDSGTVARALRILATALDDMSSNEHGEQSSEEEVIEYIETRCH